MHTIRCVFILSTLIFCSCSVYKSNGRKQFEDQSPQNLKQQSSMQTSKHIFSMCLDFATADLTLQSHCEEKNEKTN